MKVAVVGATGLVGSKMLKVLEERNFPVTELLPVASSRSVGKKVSFQGREWTVVSADEAIAKRPAVAIFSAGGAASGELAPKFAAVGCRVVGWSSIMLLIRVIAITGLAVYGFYAIITLLQPKRRKPNRSFWGDLGIYTLLAIIAVAMAFPLVFSIAMSLKPLDELFRFPPKVFPDHPTFDNFSDLIVTMGPRQASSISSFVLKPIS